MTMPFALWAAMQNERQPSVALSIAFSVWAVAFGLIGLFVHVNQVKRDHYVCQLERSLEQYEDRAKADRQMADIFAVKYDQAKHDPRVLPDWTDEEVEQFENWIESWVQANRS
jgi:hypothetical protein